ncbi:MAG: hypothetical protein SXQ77_04215 [Halobacteria archaeon]|nr:hypothetical protein [Halobacteria archaeon]
MPTVNIPSEIHEKVDEYADKHGISESQAYVELLEYALRNAEPKDDDDDLRSGIA